MLNNDFSCMMDIIHLKPEKESIAKEQMLRKVQKENNENIFY